MNAKGIGTRRVASQVRALVPPQVAWTYSMCDHVLAEARVDGQEVLHLVCGPHKLDHRRIDLFLATPGLGDIYYGRRDGKDAHLVFDLRECPFLDPYAITAACALCHGIAARVGRIWLCLPADRVVNMYCGVSGLIAGLGKRVTLVGQGPPGPGPSVSSDVLVPVQEIPAEAKLYAVLKLARERLGLLLERIRWPAAVADRAVKAIMEVAENVREHSGERGYMTLQAYGLASVKPFLVIAISDAGLGVRHTLATRHSQFRSSRVGDDRVLQELFRDRLTSRPDRRHGNGMATLQTAIQTVGGSLSMRSGAGLYVERAFLAPWVARRPTMPGTHIRLSLDAPSA